MAASELTGQSIVKSAYDTIGVYSVGESLSASDATDGLRMLNAMVSSLNIQSLAKLVVVREVFDLVADQSTYTIGPGGDFNTARPTSIQNASLLQVTNSPPNEIPLALLTDQGYQSIAMKTQTNPLPTALYYQPTYGTAGRGTIILWPVPSVSTNDLVLYSQSALVSFANPTTEYYWPEGAEEMLVFNLALRLCLPHARPVADELRKLAVQSLATFKRQNTRMVDAGNDAAMIGGYGGFYNIQSDQIQR